MIFWHQIILNILGLLGSFILMAYFFPIKQSDKNYLENRLGWISILLCMILFQNCFIGFMAPLLWYKRSNEIKAANKQRESSKKRDAKIKTNRNKSSDNATLEVLHIVLIYCFLFFIIGLLILSSYLGCKKGEALIYAIKFLCNMAWHG